MTNRNKRNKHKNTNSNNNNTPPPVVEDIVVEEELVFAENVTAEELETVGSQTKLNTKMPDHGVAVHCGGLRLSLSLWDEDKLGSATPDVQTFWSTALDGDIPNAEKRETLFGLLLNSMLNGAEASDFRVFSDTLPSLDKEQVEKKKSVKLSVKELLAARGLK